MRLFRSFLLALMCSVLPVAAQQVTVTPSTTVYSSAGGSMVLTVTLAHPSELSSLGFQISNVPAGWSLSAVGGANVPQIRPPLGPSAAFEFAYTSVPPGPISFTITTAYAAGLTGNQVFRGIQAIFRPTGAASQLVSAADIVLTSQVAGPGPGPGPANPSAPVISAQPASVAVNAGATATFSVTASGPGPLTYQWLKDGTILAGATDALLVVSNVTPASAGSYSVTVTNPGGSTPSAAALLTVTPPVIAGAPRITAQPANRSARIGDSVSFTVVATSDTAVTYQWRKDGTPVAGGTAATLTLDNVQPGDAGSYHVVVTNAAGATTSSAATLTVETAVPGAEGAYFGVFDGGRGSFALLARRDGTGVFLGFVHATGVPIVTKAVRVDAARRFRAVVVVPGPATAPAEGRAAAAAEHVVEGSIDAAGVVTGTIAGLGLTLASPAPGAGRSTAGLHGFYQAGAPANSAVGYAIVGAAGDAYMLIVQGTTADAGRGSIDPAGFLDISTEKAARVTGRVQVSSSVLVATVATPNALPTSLVGANNDARTDIEKLVNISTRSRVTSGEELIAGFVITGDRPKTVLVRGIGPALGDFGVGGALAAARLRVYKGSALIGQGDNWGDGSAASALVPAAARVGAFALASGSRDAAILLTLEPGEYTAQVSGRDGVSGVTLVEVYDATEGDIPRAQRIINISTRTTVGTGDNTLIAGFVITGIVPKRVLLRAAGPALAAFGITDALARPQLRLFAGGSAIAENTGWSGVPDAETVAQASVQAGAFPFAAGSSDAALIVNLDPGAYTAQVTGAAGAAGVALLEIYELD